MPKILRFSVQHLREKESEDAPSKIQDKKDVCRCVHHAWCLPVREFWFSCFFSPSSSTWSLRPCSFQPLILVAHAWDIFKIQNKETLLKRSEKINHHLQDGNGWNIESTLRCRLHHWCDCKAGIDQNSTKLQARHLWKFAFAQAASRPLCGLDLKWFAFA